MLPIAMGNSDFREIREKGWYYVDKSLLIRELLQDASKVVLIPRPRRFGKTLNLNMCEAFFSDQAPNRQLFEGLAIADDAHSMQHFGAYPTIAMTFKDLHADNWESCQIKLQSLISRLFHRFIDRLQPAHYQQRLIQQYLDRSAPIELVEEALLLLADLLYQSTGKKVFLLIDEYDAPIQDGHFHGFYDKIVAFCRRFFGSVLKDYPYLHKGVLTGVLRIAQESLFSGLNNIQVSTVLDQGYSRHFGFTEIEVKKILEDHELGHRESEIRNWYNGYRVGASTLYNPWSIMSVAARKPETMESYWINTSEDKLIETLITAEHCISLEDLTHLLSGEGLVKEIWPALSLNRIDGQSIWSLLLFSGYVTFVHKELETRYVLRLPNREVRFYFERIVRRWIEGSSGQIESLRELLVQGRLDAFQKYLSDRVVRLVGLNDTGGRSEPENFYHGFVLGLFAYGLDDIYEITSNREAGRGRYDVQLKPRTSGPPAYIFEFKSIRKDAEQDLTAAAKAAVDQIREKKYAVELKRSAVFPLWLVGIAFSGKALKMQWALKKRGDSRRSKKPRDSGKLEQMHDLWGLHSTDSQTNNIYLHDSDTTTTNTATTTSDTATTKTGLGWGPAGAIRKRRAALEPDSVDSQRDLSESYLKMGDFYRAEGRGNLADDAYAKALAIREPLAASEPSRADLQRELTVVYNKMGELYRVQGRSEEAAAVYAKDLAIAERLAASEPGNAELQRDLAVSYERMGLLLLDRGQKAQANALFLRSQGIMEALVQAEPNRADYIRDMAVTLYRVASADENASRSALDRAHALLLELKQTGRLDPVDEQMFEFFKLMD